MLDAGARSPPPLPGRGAPGRRAARLDAGRHRLPVSLRRRRRSGLGCLCVVDVNGGPTTMKKPKTKKPPPTKTRRRPPAVEVVLERRLDVDVRTRQLPVGDRED